MQDFSLVKDKLFAKMTPFISKQRLTLTEGYLAVAS